jgi:hypothetical protein
VAHSVSQPRGASHLGVPEHGHDRPAGGRYRAREGVKFMPTGGEDA